MVFRCNMAKLGGKWREMDFLPLRHNVAHKPGTVVEGFAGGHGGRVVTLLPPTSAAGVRSPSWP